MRLVSFLRTPLGAVALGLCFCAIPVPFGVASRAGATSAPPFQDPRDIAWCDQDAEPAARRLVASAAAAGEDSVQFAAALDTLVAVLVRNGKGARVETRALAQGAVNIKESRLGRDASELAASLRNLAATLIDAGENQQAVAVLSRVLAIDERTSPSNRVALADTLDELAHALTWTQRYEEARRAVDRALELREAANGRDRAGATRTLERLSVLLHQQGRYADARPVLERARQAQGGGGARAAEGLEQAETANLWGDQHWYEGNFAEARRSYSEAIAIAERVCGDAAPRLPVYLRNLALALTNLGDLTAAVPVSQRALAVAETNLGNDHGEVALILNDLAILRKDLGDYREARALYARALTIATKRSNRRDMATILHNLAILSARLGDFSEARTLETRAIGILERLLSPIHPNLARNLNVLAGVLSEQGREAEARPLFERAVAIRRKVLKPGDRDLILTEMNLATTYFRLGYEQRALALSQRALAELAPGDGADDLKTANALLLRADMELGHGDLAAARQHYGRALAMRERIFGDSHSRVAAAELGLARSMALSGEPGAAVEKALKAEAIRRAHVNGTLRYLAERQSLEYLAHGMGLGTGGLDLALSVARADGTDAPRVFDALIRGRSLVLDEMAGRRHGSADASSTDRAALWAALVAARQRYANLVVRGGDNGSQQFAALVAEARREKEQAERALAEKSAEFSRELTRGEVGLAEVRSAMPAGSALVAFARYDRTIIESAGLKPRATGTTTRPRKPVPSYIAFVTRAGDDNVTVVPLGPARAIDALVAKWRDEATGILRASTPAEANKTYRVAGTALRQRIWDPLRDALKDAATVFVVPDGTLNLVSLAALPVGRNRFLIEQGPVIHYLSAERDLVANQSAPGGAGLLAVGGAAFDDTSSFARTAKGQVRLKPDATGVPGACGSLQSLQFQPLAGTRREAREIAALWTDSPAQILENRGASERAFKNAAPGHRVLHLATHGFFLGSDCPPAASPGTRSVGGLSAAPKGGAKLELGESPLLLSGLALAGANRRAMAGPDEEDGILTAEEVTALNLEGVEWAVLSACDTGLGEVKAGEGVFGLRRAFQVAGVRTVIMSLWSVDDQAARVWMRALYERRLQKRLSTANAMHEASLGVLQARRARGQTTHPFYWAAFVATGAWQ